MILQVLEKITQQPLFEALRSAWSDNFDLDTDRDLRINLIRTTTLIMCAMGVPSFYLYWSLGVHSIAWGIVAAVSFSLVNTWNLERTRNVNRSAHLGVASLYLLLLCDNIVTGGFDRPNFAWLYVVPMVAAVMVELRGAWAWLGVTLATITGFWLLPSFGVFLTSSIPPDLEQGQALFSRFSAITSLGLVATAFVLINQRAKRDLAIESKYVQLLQYASMSSNEASRLEDAIEQSVERIRSLMGWELGQVYRLTSDGLLTPVSETSASHSEDERLLSSTCFRSGEGLPGRALLSRRPEFVTDLPAQEGRRARACDRLGLRSAVAIPVVSEGDVIAVLEFGTSDILKVTDHLTEVLTHVGIQIGRVAERDRLEARVRQSQKAEAVGQLAAGMAHEINNPMAYVRSNIQHLRSELASVETESPSRREDWLELINDSVEGIERTIAIVGEVKVFGESQESGGRVSDLNLIVAAAHQQLDGRSDLFAKFDVALAEELPRVVCVPNQLQRAFVNLMENAALAAGTGGEVRLTTGVDGEWLWARVEDDGPGIPEEHRSLLFDPFFTTRPVGEGTGLGLYVSSEIIATHGGEIRVESMLGAGSRFEVRLPVETRE